MGLRGGATQMRSGRIMALVGAAVFLLGLFLYMRMSSEISELQDQIETLTGSLESQSASHQAMMEEYSRCKRKVSDMDDTSKLMKSKYASLVADHSKTTSSLKDELEKCNTRVVTTEAKMQKDIAALQEELQACQDSSDEEQEEIQNAHDTIMALQDKHSELQISHAGLVEDYDKIKEQLVSQETLCASARSGLASCESSLTSMEAKLADLQKSCASGKTSKHSAADFKVAHVKVADKLDALEQSEADLKEVARNKALERPPQHEQADKKAKAEEEIAKMNEMHHAVLHRRNQTQDSANDAVEGDGQDLDSAAQFRGQPQKAEAQDAHPAMAKPDPQIAKLDLHPGGAANNTGKEWEDDKDAGQDDDIYQQAEGWAAGDVDGNNDAYPGGYEAGAGMGQGDEDGPVGDSQQKVEDVEWKAEKSDQLDAKNEDVGDAAFHGRGMEAKEVDLEERAIDAEEKEPLAMMQQVGQEDQEEEKVGDEHVEPLDEEELKQKDSEQAREFEHGAKNADEQLADNDNAEAPEPKQQQQEENEKEEKEDEEEDQEQVEMEEEKPRMAEQLTDDDPSQSDDTVF
eukprot:m.37863 g.37863  ORF g.37863 m.37863 type:complete len:574 (-) comp10140_c1_seq1:325-2046(-)